MVGFATESLKVSAHILSERVVVPTKSSMEERLQVHRAVKKLRPPVIGPLIELTKIRAVDTVRFVYPPSSGTRRPKTPILDRSAESPGRK